MNKIIASQKKMIEVLKLLKEHFDGAENLANIGYPKSIKKDSKEWVQYMFYSCLLDYGIRSKKYHQNLSKTYEKYPMIFDPNYVVENFKDKEEELFNIIKENVHPRYPNVAIKKWITLSIELSKQDILEYLKSFKNFDEINLFIKSIKGFGQKTGGLLSRILSESDLFKFDDFVKTIPLDRHDLEISYLTGLISKENLSSNEIEELSNELIETGKNLNITPNDLDKYLWEIGNRFCNKKSCEICPLRELCQTKKSVK